MNIYDAVMKGPPKWFIRFLIYTAVFMVAYNIGAFNIERRTSAAAIEQRLKEKDAWIERLKMSQHQAEMDAEIEREKLRILTCESGIRHEGIWGDGGRSYGIAQFQYPTFDDLRSQAGRPDLRWKNMNDQLWLLDWALRNGYGRYWTCYKGHKLEVVKR